MRILLINPPRWNELVGKNPSIIEKHRGFNPPLGLLYLASAINKFTNHDVEVLDTQPIKLSYPQLENFLEINSYDVVGISAMTFTLIDAFKTVNLIKKIMPNSKTVLGGTHVHLFPKETLKLAGVDFALMGEAEFSFVEFLKSYSPSNYSKIPGLIYRDYQGKIIMNDFSPIINLDDIPFPARDFLKVKNYNSLLSKGSISTIIISSRGCPFKCSFCDRPLSPVTSRFRYRSAVNVVDEICECIELGINEFLFYDDTFTVNRKRVFEICEEIIKRRIKIRWDIRTRVDLIDKEMLKMLKKAGCVAIHYGVESGNDRILKILKKGFTTRKVKEVFKITKKIGIETLGYFMIGLPSEHKREIQDTYDLAKELNPDYAHFTIFTPYPGTELYRLALEKGIYKRDIWRDFSKDPKQGFRIPVWEENFARNDLYEMIVKFYRGFYLRPGYILSRLSKIKSHNELIRKTKAGLSVFLMKKQNIDKM